MFGYEREALKAIYFGPDIEPQDRGLLCITLHCQYPNAEMWIGSRSATAFIVSPMGVKPSPSGESFRLFSGWS